MGMWTKVVLMRMEDGDGSVTTVTSAVFSACLRLARRVDLTCSHHTHTHTHTV